MVGESLTCVNCDYQGDSPVTQCPQCGGIMRSADSFRRRGWAVFIIGLLLTIFMGVLIIKEVDNVYHAGEPGAKVRYTGGTGMIVFMFGILGLFLSFGIASIANGIWLILYGKPNPNLKAIILALFFVFMAVAVFVSYLR